MERLHSCQCPPKMKEIRKRGEPHNVATATATAEEREEVAGKRRRTPAKTDGEEDEEQELRIDEETVMEVMKALEEELAMNTTCCSCSCSTNTKPYSSSSSSSFVTINGNEESCGPSFSDSASTVMANVDVSGSTIGSISISYQNDQQQLSDEKDRDRSDDGGSKTSPETITEWWWPEVEEHDDDIVSGNGVSPDGDGDDDHEWIERVLTVGPAAI